MKKIAYNKQEGTFLERVFCPTRIKVISLEHPKKRTWEQARHGDIKLVIEDANTTINVEGTRLVSRVLQYLRPYTNIGSLKAMKELPATQLEKVLNRAVKKADGKQMKAMYNDQGVLCGIVSTMHSQISWGEVRKIIEGCIREICGKVEQPESYGHFNAESPFRWTYRLPLKNKNMSAWVGVHAGNNLIKGRSGIHVSSKWRTEREGSGGAPACLNWCGMWEIPLKWFNIDTQRLNNVVKVVGQQNVDALKLAQFHIKADMQKFKSRVKEQLAGMVKAVEAIKTVIDDSVHSPLSRKEMEAILTAYKDKVKLPNYIIEQIMAHIEEETVWGFSQAVSWVRTHGDFKAFRICKPIEDRPLTRTLENIAGEVLSLTPTINDFHDKVGKFTLDNLVPKEEAVATATV